MAGNSSEIKPRFVKTFSCPNCGGTVDVRAPGHTLSAACIHCGSVISTSNENYQVIQKAKQQLTRLPLIPLGSRGALAGRTWEVIGFMVREDIQWHFEWEEYLLFNPVYGFRWLVQSAGHWTLVSAVTDKPDYKGGEKYFSYKGNKYEQFSTGAAKVNYVYGEFYWRVQVHDRTNVADFISPPFVLSLESDSEGRSWSIGEYVEPEAVQEAFQLKGKIPQKESIGINQPNPFKKRARRMWPVTAITVIAMVIMQAVFGLVTHREKVMEKEFSMFTPDSVFTTGPFVVGGRLNNLMVTLKAPLINAWLDVSLSLRDVTRNESQYASYPLSYYEGVEDGESWTEGSKELWKVMHNVRNGEHIIMIDAERGYDVQVSPMQPLFFTLVVERNVTSFSNFIIALVLILLPFLYNGIRSIIFEGGRYADQ